MLPTSDSEYGTWDMAGVRNLNNPDYSNSSCVTERRAKRLVWIIGDPIYLNNWHFTFEHLLLLGGSPAAIWFQETTWKVHPNSEKLSRSFTKPLYFGVILVISGSLQRGFQDRGSEGERYAWACFHPFKLTDDTLCQATSWWKLLEDDTNKTNVCGTVAQSSD